MQQVACKKAVQLDRESSAVVLRYDGNDVANPSMVVYYPGSEDRGTTILLPELLEKIRPDVFYRFDQLAGNLMRRGVLHKPLIVAREVKHHECRMAPEMELIKILSSGKIRVCWCESCRDYFFHTA